MCSCRKWEDSRIINNCLGNYEREIVYIRFLKNRKIERVARCDTTEGIAYRLMHSDDPKSFLTEAFAHVDDNSKIGQIERRRIKDKVWLRLLDGEEIKNILKDYKPTLMGNHYYCPKNTSENEALNYRVFRISDIIN